MVDMETTTRTLNTTAAENGWSLFQTDINKWGDQRWYHARTDTMMIVRYEGEPRPVRIEITDAEGNEIRSDIGGFGLDLLAMVDAR